MFTVDSYSLAVVLSIITMICWGSWPNTQKLVRAGWRFELFYWDFVIGIVAVTLLFSLSLGSFGSEGRSFLDDILQVERENVLSALLGGVLFNLANILFVAAIALAGMSLAFPLGSGLGLVLGVLTNYLANPEGNGLLLFSGVVAVAAAMILSSLAYRRMSALNNNWSVKGIVLALLAGLLFGAFYRFIANAMYPDFNNPEPGKLGPYAATVFFALGVLVSNFLFNTLLMKYPVKGAPVRPSAYFKGIAQDHWMGIAGGMIWGTGLVLSILSAGAAGFAISFGLGQGNALVAAIWGVFVWKEFKTAPAGTGKLLYMMFILYLIGLILIVFAKT